MCKMAGPAKLERRVKNPRNNNRGSVYNTREALLVEGRRKANEAVRRFRDRQSRRIAATKKKIQVMKKQKLDMDIAMAMMDKDMILIRQAIQAIKENKKKNRGDAQPKAKDHEEMQVEETVIDLTRMKDFTPRRQPPSTTEIEDGSAGSSQMPFSASQVEEIEASSSQRSQG